MSEATPPRVSFAGQGTVTVRRRPALLLMLVKLRAAEVTLELGLKQLKRRCDATAKLLTRLGAARVDCGDPHFDNQAEKNPMARMAAEIAPRMSGRPAAEPAAVRGVNAVLTAVWDIAALTADETLILVDRLSFEAAADPEPADAPEEPKGWATPEEQLRTIVAQTLHRRPAEDKGPQFLFVSRLDEQELERAMAEAFGRAVRTAERLARTAGLKPGRLTIVQHLPSTMGNRTDLLMDRQRCVGLLVGSTFDPGDGDVISDSPKAAEFAVTMHAHYSTDLPAV